MRLKMRPYCLRAPTPSWIFAPPESMSPMTGMRRRRASSRRRTILSPLDGAQGPAGDGEVLGVDGHLTAVDLPEAGDDAGGTGLLTCPGAGVAADLQEGGVVQQVVDALPSGRAFPWRVAGWRRAPRPPCRRGRCAGGRPRWRASPPSWLPVSACWSRRWSRCSRFRPPRGCSRGCACAPGHHRRRRCVRRRRGSPR